MSKKSINSLSNIKLKIRRQSNFGIERALLATSMSLVLVFFSDKVKAKIIYQLPKKFQLFFVISFFLIDKEINPS
jgi:hypothetical protein